MNPSLSVSAHQLPLAEEVAELVGPECLRYIDAGGKSESAQRAEVQGLKFKVQRLENSVAEAATGVQRSVALQECRNEDVVMCGLGMV